MAGLALGIRIAVAGVFALAGGAKLFDREGSRRALEDFGVPARVAKLGRFGLPVAELLIAGCLLVPASAWLALAAAISLLATFVVAIAISIARGTAPDCHCFGQLHSEPAGWRALARNGVLLTATAVALALGRQASRLSPLAWVGQLNGTELCFAAVGIALLMIVAVQGWFVFELLRRHGRILARLEALERLRVGADEALTALAVRAPASNGNGRLPGLAVGVLAPEFDLRTLDGARLSLSALRARGAPVALIFTDPRCGPCSALLPQVADWQHRHRDRLTIAVISRRGVESNRPKAQEHGLENVLLQEDREVSDGYQAHGTPAAVTVSADGRIASSVSAGADAIRALIELSIARRPQVGRSGPNRATNGHRAASPVVPGPAVGSEAPGGTFEDLDGRRLSLRELRGEAVVLLFWSPGCGFCQRMLPGLRAWEDQRPPGSPALLVISTGTVESNRAMGLVSRVVIDQSFQTARSYGASGTPSAIRIDPTGHIATPLAVGVPGVLALLGASQPAQPGIRVGTGGPLKPSCQGASIASTA